MNDASIARRVTWGPSGTAITHDEGLSADLVEHLRTAALHASGERDEVIYADTGTPYDPAAFGWPDLET